MNHVFANEAMGYAATIARAASPLSRPSLSPEHTRFGRIWSEFSSAETGSLRHYRAPIGDGDGAQGGFSAQQRHDAASEEKAMARRPRRNHGPAFKAKWQ
jgi:hypothetical protein